MALTLSDSFCVSRHRDDFRGLVEDEVDLLFGNADEVCSLYEVATFDEAAERIARELRAGDIFFTVGAGDVNAVGPMVLDRLARGAA